MIQVAQSGPPTSGSDHPGSILRAGEKIIELVRRYPHFDTHPVDLAYLVQGIKDIIEAEEA